MAARRETVEQKGWRLFVSGAVRRDGRHWRVRGDHGEYEVERGHCNCPSFHRCSHEVAVEFASGIAPAPADTIQVNAERLAELLRLEILTNESRRAA